MKQPTAPPDQRAVIRLLQEPLLDAMRLALGQIRAYCEVCSASPDGGKCDYCYIAGTEKILQEAIESSK